VLTVADYYRVSLDAEGDAVLVMQMLRDSADYNNGPFGFDIHPSPSA
jgi:hypothetical protein